MRQGSKPGSYSLSLCETGESSKPDSDSLSLCETGESSKPGSDSLSLCETDENILPESCFFLPVTKVVQISFVFSDNIYVLHRCHVWGVISLKAI